MLLSEVHCTKLSKLYRTGQAENRGKEGKHWVLVTQGENHEYQQEVQQNDLSKRQEFGERTSCRTPWCSYVLLPNLDLFSKGIFPFRICETCLRFDAQLYLVKCKLTSGFTFCVWIVEPRLTGCEPNGCCPRQRKRPHTALCTRIGECYACGFPYHHSSVCLPSSHRSK